METTSKVSLELTTRMNLGRWGVRAKLSILDVVYKPLRSLERVVSSKKRSIVPAGTTINPCKTDKTAENGNPGQCLSGNHKQSVTRTYHRDEPRKGRLSILDIVHKLLRSLKRVNQWVQYNKNNMKPRKTLVVRQSEKCFNSKKTKERHES